MVEDTQAPELDRAAAALAATASVEADAEVKTRVRIAAEATASPKLRASLEHIADAPPDEPDESLTPCLEELAVRKH